MFSTLLCVSLIPRNAPAPAGGSVSRGMSPFCALEHLILPPRMEGWNRNQGSSIICLQAPHPLSSPGLHSAHKLGIGLNGGKRRENPHGTYLMRAPNSKFTQIDLSREKLSKLTGTPLKLQEEAQTPIFCGLWRAWERLVPALLSFGAGIRVWKDGRCFLCGTHTKPGRAQGLFHQPQSTCQPG